MLLASPGSIAASDFLAKPPWPTILEAMGELKSCLFCGKRVDEAFEYCPHCGSEFGEGDETVAFGGDRSAGERAGGDPSVLGPELPGLLPDADCCVPEEDEGYLNRLRTLQEILADMERELDVILGRGSDPASKHS